MWHKNIRKKKRQSGQEYTSITGKTVPHRKFKEKDCSKCIYKCNDSFPLEEQSKINSFYWGLGSTKSQREMIKSLVVERPVGRKRTANLKRKCTVVYSFPSTTAPIALIRVCKSFFLATLSISDAVVYTVLKKTVNGCVLAPSNQGKAKKSTEFDSDLIKTHIQSFPMVPSHYCRKDTNYKYLSSDLNIRKMYQLFKSYCCDNNLPPAKEWLYRDIFNTEFQLKFHSPRKDICDSCFRFSQATTDEKDELKHSQDLHIARKERAKEFKISAKESAKRGEINLIEFDLEAVRYCPYVKAKTVFYKRQLAVYNLTIYDVASCQAVCYMWHEAVAGRGSNEISSCVFDYLKTHANGKPFVLLSDTCGGQNRNANMASMLLYAVKHLNMPYIDQAFFEPGHSMMECDSVHAHIQRATKNLNIFSPFEWYGAVKVLGNQKYTVEEMGQDRFFNVKKMRQVMIKNRKVDVDNTTVNWLHMTWFRYEKTNTDHILFKYDKNEVDFRKIKIERRRSKRADAEVTLERVVPGRRPIPIEKAKDLRELCKMGIIPTQYHSFYEEICSGAAGSEPEAYNYSDQE